MLPFLAGGGEMPLPPIANALYYCSSINVQVIHITNLQIINGSARKLLANCLRTAYLNGTSLAQLIFSSMALKHLLQGCFATNGIAGILGLCCQQRV